ncbi:cutinase precursor [Seiridium cupressi]|uniref:cutinase n=1 Tax=Seiridium unicorne TaxID=138068 RepID=A0ABR2VC69_9PEZI
MKFSVSLVASFLVAFASTSPIEIQELQERKTYGTTSDEYVDNGCNDVLLFFARGSTQSGNVGDMPGQQLATAVSAYYGTKLYVQGVDYPASLEGNTEPGRCPAAYAKKWGTQLTQAATKCPDAVIVIAGYSQGAAMVHAALKTLTATTASRIAAAVTFGDTYYQQDGNKIPVLDASKTKVFCNKGDLVCNGTLDITAAHTNYKPSVPSGAAFIKEQVDLAKFL